MCGWRARSRSESVQMGYGSGGIPPERGPVGDHLRREIGADAGERLESGAVRLVQVDAGNVDVRFQPVEDGIGHHIRLGEVRGPAEPASFGPVVQDGLGLLLRKAQTHQVFQRGRVRVESEGFYPARGSFFPDADGVRVAFRRFPKIDRVGFLFSRLRFRGRLRIRFRPDPFDDIHGVRVVAVCDQTRHRRLVHEQGGFESDDEEYEGDGARGEATLQGLLSLPLFHNASS